MFIYHLWLPHVYPYRHLRLGLPPWRGVCYPASVSEEDRLSHHTRHLASVKINRSFYRLTTRGPFAGWRQATPERLVFAVKASRFITPMKRLRQTTLPPLLDQQR